MEVAIDAVAEPCSRFEGQSRPKSFDELQAVTIRLAQAAFRGRGDQSSTQAHAAVIPALLQEDTGARALSRAGSAGPEVRGARS